MDNTTKRATCMECNQTFGRNSNLRAHVRRFHYEKLDEIAPQIQRSSMFFCTRCGKGFTGKKNLTIHLKSHEIKNMNKKRKCPMCDYVVTFRRNFYIHLKDVHEITVETEYLSLKLDEFKNWKNAFEGKNKSRFVLERGATKNTIQYICHRSGFFKPRGKGIRHIKAQGSYKIDGFCPASITVVEGNGKLTVLIVKTHVGHQIELEHLPLSIQERQSLAAKIDSKIPFGEILDGIHNSVTSAPMERLHLLTRKDLYNIETNFNLNSAKLQEIRKRHKTSLDLQKTVITKVNRFWEIQSTLNLAETCKVFENSQHCNCQLVCTECNTCIHQYSCSCLDSAVTQNICRHIHMLCQWKMEQGLTNEVNDRNGDQIIHLDAQNIKSEATFQDIQLTFNTSTLPLNEKKRMLKKEFDAVVNSAGTEEELEAIKSLMKPMHLTLAAMKASKSSTRYKPVTNIRHMIIL